MISGKKQNGYSTAFDFEAKDVEKGWWRYSREFGRPLNMRGYYKVTIPSDINSGTVDLELFSKSESAGLKSRFFLSLNADNIPKALVADYMKQLKIILLDFKKNYYIEYLENVLEGLEKKAKKASKRVSKANDKSREHLLNELESLQNSIEETKNSLKQVYNAF